MKRFPESIAIAGAWGYIGRLFLDAAVALGLRTYVYDPGPAPDDLALDRVTRVASEEEFYRLPADLFHLAVHPEHRQKGLSVLLDRASKEQILVLVEKPMAPPERPEECRHIIEATNRSNAVVLYDFPELFDPITHRIGEFLAGFRAVEITSIYVQRSKDREDPANPRNYKRMVDIQYQESVHCLAFALNLLARVRGGLGQVFDGGLWLAARSEPYRPPNPQDYPRVVDGKCEFVLKLGGVTVEGLTDFKKGAEWAKRRIIRGLGDGKPFLIEAEFLEGEKHLIIVGEDQGFNPNANSYGEVIETFGRWYNEEGAERLMSGLYPHPEFARMTYQISSALWRSCRDRAPISLYSVEDLKSFDARFAAAIDQTPRHGA